ncbi:hypothetical protein [Micromonospora rosaria]|nr:hypothetical protein [Micromonospora rosaria]
MTGLPVDGTTSTGDTDERRAATGIGGGPAAGVGAGRAVSGG